MFMMPEFMRVLEYIVDVLHAGLAVGCNRDVGSWVNSGECMADCSCFCSETGVASRTVSCHLNVYHGAIIGIIDTT